jgi:hypothetical protein
MEIFIFSFVVIALAVVGMAVGVLLGRRSIKGSCGGLSNVEGLDAECPVCSGTCEEQGKGRTEKPNPVISEVDWRDKKSVAETRDHASIN